MFSPNSNIGQLGGGSVSRSTKANENSWSAFNDTSKCCYNLPSSKKGFKLIVVPSSMKVLAFAKMLTLKSILWLIITQDLQWTTPDDGPNQTQNSARMRTETKGTKKMSHIDR